MQNVLLDFLYRRTLERHLASEVLIENASEAPNIALEVTRLLTNNLRCLVPYCARVLYEALVVLEIACQTKVSNFDLWGLALTAQQDVLVLDVAVHNTFLVDVH